MNAKPAKFARAIRRRDVKPQPAQFKESAGRTVAVYGAGIAGLSAAHELSRRGWHVSIYESTADAGGFFRSTRRSGDQQMPWEYSWHGMGPWYHNVFDLMRQIPFDADGSVYD